MLFRSLTPDGSDSYAACEEFDPSGVNMSDPEQAEVAKTVKILQNKLIYAHNYLNL